MSSPSVSVVIPAYRARVTLPRVLDALEPQVAGRDRELLVVESTGDGFAAEIADRWPWAQVVRRASRTPQGLARNLGAEAARAPAVAFLDADAVPAGDWLDELERELRPGIEMVAGAVLNGAPSSACSQAAHLLEFLEWLPPRNEPLLHAASCNLLVDRAAFLAAGGFPTDVWTGEDTILSYRFGERGTLTFAAGAHVYHLNRTTVREFLLDQYKHGVGFYGICARVSFPSAECVRERRLLAALSHRLLGLEFRLRALPAERWRAVKLAPILTAGLAAWLTGLASAPNRAFPTLPKPGCDED